MIAGMGSDGWQILAALATTASAGVIAWQAWLTRRSLKSTDAALKEAELSRIDAGAPTSLLIAFPDIPDGPRAYLRPRPNEYEANKELGAGDVLVMPGEASRILAINTRVDVHNVGAVPAYVETDLPVVPIWNSELKYMPPPVERIFLVPGQHWEGWVVVEKSLEEWVARLDDEPDPINFRVRYEGPRHGDVIVEARAELGGSPIARTEYNGSAYRVRTDVVAPLLTGRFIEVTRRYK